ncbi:hypothetical protein B566_EDAN010220 [Ephemera danica]|nr:hypothetical protein B566_EDAN010220 [Ephemera danica]
MATLAERLLTSKFITVESFIEAHRTTGNHVQDELTIVDSIMGHENGHFLATIHLVSNVHSACKTTQGQRSIHSLKDFEPAA